LVESFSIPMAIQAMCEFVGIGRERSQLLDDAADVR
jgi:hypothetical protein